MALPYKGGRFRQVLVLPAAGGADARSAAALAASLSSGPAVASLRAALARGAAERVRLRLPRFRLEYGVKDLRPALSAAGLRSAFDADGGFLGVADDPLLRLSKVLHKAVVEVNEEGTEAAAATAAVMMTRSARIEPPPVRASASRRRRSLLRHPQPQPPSQTNSLSPVVRNAARPPLPGPPPPRTRAAGVRGGPPVRPGDRGRAHGRAALHGARGRP